MCRIMLEDYCREQERKLGLAPMTDEEMEVWMGEEEEPPMSEQAMQLLEKSRRAASKQGVKIEHPTKDPAVTRAFKKASRKKED